MNHNTNIIPATYRRDAEVRNHENKAQPAATKAASTTAVSK